jgi:RNA polymerase sigma-70 factor (ECF subfamily)
MGNNPAHIAAGLFSFPRGLLSSFAVRTEARSDHMSETDAQDVKGTLQGDGNAYARIVERYQQHVGQLMWRFTRDRGLHAELVHDVFVEAYFSLKSYREKSPLEHWLARIATRVGYRFWTQRDKQRQQIEWAATLSEEPHAPGNDLDNAEEVHLTLAQLPPRDRLVLTLMYLDQCSVEETAERTGWTRTMVKVQAHRARGKLRKILESRQ